MKPWIKNAKANLAKTDLLAWRCFFVSFILNLILIAVYGALYDEIQRLTRVNRMQEEAIKELKHGVANLPSLQKE